MKKKTRWGMKKGILIAVSKIVQKRVLERLRTSKPSFFVMQPVEDKNHAHK